MVKKLVQMNASLFRAFLNKHKVYYPFLELLKLNSINVSLKQICELKNDLWISESVDLECGNWQKINEKYLKLISKRHGTTRSKRNPKKS